LLEAINSGQRLRRGGRARGRSRDLSPDERRERRVARGEKIRDKKREQRAETLRERTGDPISRFDVPVVTPSISVRDRTRSRDLSPDERQESRIARGERIKEKKEKRRKEKMAMIAKRSIKHGVIKKRDRLDFSRILPKSQLEKMQRKTGGNAAVKKRLAELKVEREERVKKSGERIEELRERDNLRRERVIKRQEKGRKKRHKDRKERIIDLSDPEKRSDSLKRAKDRIEKYKRKREEGRKDRSFASPTERSFQKPRRRNYFRPRGEALPPSRYIRARDAKVSNIHAGRGVGGGRQPRDELAKRLYKGRGRWPGHIREVIPRSKTYSDPTDFMTPKEIELLEKSGPGKGYTVKRGVQPRGRSWELHLMRQERKRRKEDRLKEAMKNLMGNPLIRDPRQRFRRGGVARLKRRIPRGGGGIIPRRGFQTGGAVTGGGSGGPNFESFTKSVERIGNSFGSFNKGVSDLSSAVGDFSNAVNKFTEAVGGIPHELNITGEKTLNINLNGGALLREIMPEITSMIQSEIAEALRDSIDTSMRMRAQNKAAGMKRGDRR